MSARLESLLDRERRAAVATNDQIERLNALGFDRSACSDEGGVRVACSRCEALVINGTPCHETGCPNAMRECSGCNNLIPALRFRRFCEDCQ